MDEGCFHYQLEVHAYYATQLPDHSRLANPVNPGGNANPSLLRIRLIRHQAVSIRLLQPAKYRS